MSLKRRMERLSARAAVWRVPMLIIDSDGTAFCRGRRTSVEAWQADYREEIERERKAGRQVFGIDFSPVQERP